MSSVTRLIDQLQSLSLVPNAADKGEKTSPALSSTQLAEAAQAVADELIALQAIYGDDRVALLTVQRLPNGSVKSVLVDDEATDPAATSWSAHEPIRLAITVTLDCLSQASTEAHAAKDDDQKDGDSIRLSAILPCGYPVVSSPPQLQLLSRYIGSYGVDHTLFGQILRIFMQTTTTSRTNDHVTFEPGQVILFDGIERARELAEAWYLAREEERIQRDRTEDERPAPVATSTERPQEQGQGNRGPDRKTQGLPDDSSVRLVSAPAITERKSIFVGHAAALSDPSQVAAILNNLLQDRRIARATHPAIYAWVCRTDDGVLHRDCDDDGEQAAGGRLAHLLDLLHVERAIVIVSRWYGGVLLGPDRFKLINRAARDALEAAGVVKKAR